MMFSAICKIIMGPQEKPRLVRELEPSGGEVVFTRQGTESRSVLI